MSFVQVECGQSLENSKHKYQWSLAIVCICLLIIWVFMRNLNVLKVMSAVNLREYNLEHINADEFSALLQIDRKHWDKFLETYDRASKPPILEFEELLKK
jgi:hypothetical protein